MNTATQQVKQNIKKMAQQFANEPLEILKTARKQITDEERGYEDKSDESKTEKQPQNQEYEKQIAEQDGRKLEALESELRDIRRQKLFNELLAKIQSGVEVSIEEFQELSAEQREVLKAHLENINAKKESDEKANIGFIEPNAKQGRRMVFGKKQSAQKQTTRVEKPVPPSG